jgi:RNA-directed DNA polymerase
MKILPDLSPIAFGTPGLLQPAVTQRHIETEVAKCVGGVVSPVIANLFLHYAFDAWMARKFPDVAFERYVDDAVIHCATEHQAREVLAALQERMSEAGLALHPDKTRIVCAPRAQRERLGL